MTLTHEQFFDEDARDRHNNGWTGAIDKLDEYSQRAVTGGVTWPQSSSEHGNFYWNELMTRDVEKAKKFYGDTIGWTFDAMPMPDGTYWVAKMGDKPVGGLFPTRAARNSTACRKAGCPISRSTTSMRA